MKGGFFSPLEIDELILKTPTETQAWNSEISSVKNKKFEDQQ